MSRTVRQQLQWENRQMREMLTSFIAASKERESASRRYRYHLSRGTASSYLTSRVISAAIVLGECVKAAQAFLAPTPMRAAESQILVNENWSHSKSVSGEVDGRRMYAPDIGMYGDIGFMFHELTVWNRFIESKENEAIRVQKLNPDIPPKMIRSLVMVRSYDDWREMEKAGEPGYGMKHLQQANPCSEVKLPCNNHRESWDKHSIALFVGGRNPWRVSYMFGDLS